MSHAPIAPSSLHRIRWCPASRGMQLKFPNLPWEDPEASEEGTCAHWVVQRLAGPERKMAEVGELDPNGTPVTQEMREGAETVLEHVEPFLDILKVEEAVDCHAIHPECWGTPDIRYRLANGMTHIHIIDYKFGFRFVSEFENEQLMAYTAGAIAETGSPWEQIRVTNTIIQPRCYAAETVRSWAYDAPRILPLIRELAAAAADSLGPDPIARATRDGCRDCRARHACSVLRHADGAAMDYAGTPVAQELDPLALGIELRYARRMLGLLDARVKGLTAQAEYLLARGQRIAHHVAKPGRGSTVWKADDQAILAMGAALGVNLAKPPEPCTPNQALARGLREEIVKGVSEKRPGAMSLAEDDGSMARRVFGRA